MDLAPASLGPEGAKPAVLTLSCTTPRHIFQPEARAGARSGEEKSKPQSRAPWRPDFGQFAHVRTRIAHWLGEGGRSHHLPDLESTYVPRCCPSNDNGSPIPTGPPHMPVFAEGNTKRAITFDFVWRGIGGARRHATTWGVDQEMPWGVRVWKTPSHAEPIHYATIRLLPNRDTLESRVQQGWGLQDRMPPAPSSAIRARGSQ